MPSLVYNADVERSWFFLRWRHTVMPMVVRDPIFWLAISFHTAILFLQKDLLSRGESLPDLDWKASSLLWSLLTFFVVFYGGNCYNRYYQFYGACTGLGGALGEWAYLIRAHFDVSSPVVKWNILRLMLGAMELQLMSLSGSDDKGGKGLDAAEWDTIRKHGFLSKDEIIRLQRHKGSKAFLPAIWALSEVRSALKAKLQRMPAAKAALAAATTLPSSDFVPPESKPQPKKPSASAEHEAEATLLHTPGAMAIFEDFEQTVLKFKGHCGVATNLLKMPVPFAYFHVLKLLLMISLFMTSFALIELEHAQFFLSMAVFVVICVIMIGLQAVAVAMSDPFGDDDIDFDLDKFLIGAYDNTIAIVTDQRTAMHDRLPADMDGNFPLADTEAAKAARVWKTAFDGSASPARKALPQSKTVTPPITPPASMRSQPGGRSAYKRLEEKQMLPNEA